jgi:hypothetical protein
MGKIPFTPLTMSPAGEPLPIVLVTLMILLKISSDVLHDDFFLMTSLLGRASLGHDFSTVEQALLVPLCATAGFPRSSVYVAKFCPAAASEFRCQRQEIASVYLITYVMWLQPILSSIYLLHL